MEQQNIKEYKFNPNVIKKANNNTSFSQIMSAYNVDYGNVLRIKRKKLIIVFVPGIMASRLVDNSTGDMIWDPDSFGVMKTFFNCIPKKRQDLLLPDSPLSIPKKNTTYLTRRLKKYPYVLERGWHTISWTYYGALIESLDKWSTQIKTFIDMKIYVFGYNWLQSNEISENELNVMLTDLVAQEKRRSEDIKVLLISHSIGGLVVRECIKIDDMGLISGLIWKIGKYLIISGCDARLIPAQNEQEIGEIRRSISEMEEYSYMCYSSDNIDRFSYIYSQIFQNNTFTYLQADWPIYLDEQKILYDLCAIGKYKTCKMENNMFFSHDDIKKIKYVIKNICFT